MLYHPPLLPYSGLTIVLSKPSRIDLSQLLSGYPGQFLERTLSPFSRHNCDIRLVGEHSPLLPNTKVILRMGELAKSVILQDYTLNEVRGNTYARGDIVNICTYELQDCFDRKNYTQPGDDEVIDDEDDTTDEGTGKEHSKTRRKNYRYWLYNDIKKAIDIIKNGYKPKLLFEQFRIYPSIEEITTLLNTTTNNYLYLDIETNENFNITVISISLNESPVFTIPILCYDGSLSYGKEKICRFLAALSRSFESNTVVIYNSSFDLTILAWRYKIVPPRIIEDPMVMQHRVSPETEKSLGHAISLYLHEEFHKAEGIFNTHNMEQDRQLWLYNAKDVATLRLVHKAIKQVGIEQKLEASFDRANRLIRPYLLQNLMGIKVNEELRKELLEEQEALKVQYLRIIKILTGYEWETLSWQRIAKYLYEYKSYPKPQPQWINGKLQYKDLTASHTLYKLAIKYNIPFLRVLFCFRHAIKKAGFLKFDGWSSLVNQYNNKSNRNRFTSSDKVTGTDTYRLASTKLFGQKNTYKGTEDFNGWGSNKQNIEKKLRKILIADESKSLVQSDQAGAEALVVAYIAPRGKYRLLFENKVKVHSYVALHLFQKVWEKHLEKPVDHLLSLDIPSLKLHPDWKLLEKIIKSSDDWPPSQRYYYIAKMVCHASNYGMKAPTFVTNVLKKSEGLIVLSTQEANRFLELYHTLFPEIRQWHFQVICQLEKDHTLYNLLGDRRIFQGELDQSLYQKAYAYVPQSTVGMITNLAIAEIQEQIDQRNPEYLDIDILANGHDAILSQTLIGKEQQLATIQERHLAKTFLKDTPNEFTMRSESQWGFSWGEMRELKN